MKLKESIKPISYMKTHAADILATVMETHRRSPATLNFLVLLFYVVFVNDRGYTLVRYQV